jgi:hypothetical protein
MKAKAVLPQNEKKQSPSVRSPLCPPSSLKTKSVLQSFKQRRLVSLNEQHIFVEMKRHCLHVIVVQPVDLSETM